jgi:arylsulfatase
MRAAITLAAFRGVLLGKSEKSNREGFPVLVADRLEAVKWRNWKLTFYEEQRDW